MAASPVSTSLQVVQPPQLPTYAEQNVSMVQQLAQAQIQSAYIMAERHRRDFDVIEQQILKECRRPQFCAIDPDPKKYGSSVAMYGVPRGGSYENGRWVPNIVRDLTIRFAEMALTYIKNVSVDLWPMGEDDEQRIFRAVRIDYESNVAEGEIIIVPKTVERRSTKDGDVVLGQRTNSDGKTVYIVRATNEEMDQSKRAQYSKAKRNLILSILPGWLKEEAKEEIRATQRKVDAQDPDAARKVIYAGFAKVGVSVEELKAYLGHGNDLTPAEMEEMRMLYAAIAEGLVTWKTIVAAKEENTEDGTAEAIEQAFQTLEMAPAVIRKTKGQYIGRSKELLAYLNEQLAKKQVGTPAAKQEAEKSPAKEEEQKESSTASGPPQTQSTLDTQPEPVRARKQSPPPPPPLNNLNGW